MKILKYTILTLILLHLPAALLQWTGGAIGTVSSYGSFLLLLLYYAFIEKTSFNTWMLVLGFTYYLISSFNYVGDTDYFVFTAIKYFIVIISGYELMKRVNKTELFYFLLIGALSVGINAIFFPSKFGRYSGFYLNPNVAGFICIFGYGLTYGVRNITIKLSGQFIFTLMGLLTFSRTFIVIWLLINLISLKISIKNIRIFAIGALIFGTLLVIDEFVGLNNPRFQQLKSLVNNEDVSSEELSEDSRTATWARYYPDILEAPVFGNGYGALAGELGVKAGVHNSYLLVVGEAGIIPFFIMIALFIYFIHWGMKLFKEAPNIIMQTIGLAAFLLANHNFFNFYFIPFSCMWLYYQIDYYRDSRYNNQHLIS